MSKEMASDMATRIKKAEQVDITLVAESLGYPLKEFPKYWQSIDHPSLRFYKNTNTYHWYSNDRGGNTINFCRNEATMNFKESLDYLLNSDFKQVDSTKMYQKKEPFSYYFKHDHSFKEVRDYLVNERKLDGTIIDALHKRGFIRQDIFKQCIFAWSKNGKIVGASIQGTIEDWNKYERGRFKGIAKNVEKNFGFNVSLGNPDKMFIFESPIDLLSYWSLNKQLKNAMLVSMDGVKEASVQKLTDYCIANKGFIPTKGIYISTDNDREGQRFYQKFENKTFEIIKPVPSEVRERLSAIIEQQKEQWKKIEKTNKLAKERRAFLSQSENYVIHHMATYLENLPSSYTAEETTSILSEQTVKFIDSYVNEQFVGYDPDKAIAENLEKITIPFHNNIPDNSAIPESLIELYQGVITEMESPIDWKLVASVHKYETNLSNTNELVNIENIPLYFGEETKKIDGKKLAPTPHSKEMLKKSVQQLVNDFEKAKVFTTYSIKKLLTNKGLSPSEIESAYRKINKVYDLYTNQGYTPVSTVNKDWNDKLQVEMVQSLAKQTSEEVTKKEENELLKTVYKNNASNQQLSIEKDDSTHQLKATVHNNQHVIGYFEASNADEMIKLIKNYGFQAVAKDDLKKYKSSAPKKMQQTLAR